jgi:CMP-N-acetylneuraminic acid synthetase
MDIVALIPARGGSKSIPHKNITPLAGRPLLAYTAEAAQESRYLTRILLSTDDEAIAQVGRECGIEVPFKRPPELARDYTTSLAVAQHTIRWLEEHDNWKPDILVLLQPTSPLRRSHHIDEALDRMLEAGADTVVSVVEVPHRYSPYSVMELRDGNLENFWREPLPFDRYRRQNMPTFYARNGPAILATRVPVLFEHQSFYGPRVVPYVMPDHESVDIDGPDDLRLAEWLLGQREQTG